MQIRRNFPNALTAKGATKFAEWGDNSNGVLIEKLTAGGATYWIHLDVGNGGE